MNRLKGQRVYLVGAMDRVSDMGAGWRDYITPDLIDMGIHVFNPLTKPINIGLENYESHKERISLKENQDYDTLTKVMKIIRNVDLRMVDISDFIIVNLDLDTHPCGTYEEIFTANRQKKPIIVRIEQGKQYAPDWLFGTIPHQMIFSSWKEIKDYLHMVNSSDNIETFNRWYFFSK
jgi:hypothetical protein